MFNQAVIKVLDAYARQRLLPKKIQAAFPLLIGGIVGFVLPEILGGGNSLIDKIADGHFGLAMLLVILGAKFLFTMLSYGAGVPGGIFLPMLVLGALIGGVFSKTILFFGFSHDYHVTWMLLGMAAYFTAIVKAPVTGSILITEMTGSFRHLPETIAVCMVAYIVADIARSKPIYDTLLERSLQPENPNRQETGQQTITEMIVCMGSQLDDRRIRDVEWPADCLLVCIRRGEQDIVPKGDIKLTAGDYLYIVSDERYTYDIRTIAE
ncbi:chloride channel protein [Acetonema longum]|uniref:Cl-channel, voltage-gated family protein n=1 Tax=Acetonema longum DSM 6540 TaxID=1009370 RepID=F7NJ44_9FIRM|nr:chloride channel protein [Acetonema longum]EGO63934.1 Cl- channel, voltage-gated family protein [Acetonema longum DSM 6540]